MSTTLASLRLQCQQQTDLVNSGFVSNAEWLGYINSSYLELYGNIVQHFGNDYFVQSTATGFPITTTGLTQFYALPTDFFKMLGLDLQLSSPGGWASLREFAFADRNKYSNLTNSEFPAAGQVLRLFYVPRATLLASDSDTIDGVNGWEEFIIVDASIKALAKEESDVSVFEARRQQLETRLAAEIENRNAGESARIVDTRGKGSYGMRYRLNGNNLWLIGGQTRNSSYYYYDDDERGDWY